jgi:PAS domain S-box-containing protein
MENNAAAVIDTIVSTLLHVGQRVVEISREGVICRIWDNEGNTPFESPNHYIGKAITELNQDAFFGQSADRIEESFRRGQNAYLEHTVKFNGATTTYGIRILLIHPDKDKLFLVAELLDKSPVKKTEINVVPAEAKQLLEEQRVFYEKILNNISADIVVLDAEYRFLYLNPEAVKDEETRKWLIGKTDEDFFIHRNKPRNLADRRRHMYDAATHERRVIEWVEKTQNLLGEIKFTLRRIIPVFDAKGSLEVLIGYAMNITEHMTMQEELKTSRDTFKSAFNDSGIGMALLTPDGKWIDANKVLCDVIGYSKEELMKKELRDVTYPEERPINKELVKKMLRREIPNFTLERRYISKQGKIIFTLFTLSLVWGKDGTPKFFIAQAVDITKMKDLERSINRKNVELEAATINLNNKVAQLEELSYIVAHNLRGPAGNIKLLSDALMAKNDPTHPESSLSDAFSVEEGLGFINEASTSLMNSLASLMKIAEVKLNKDVPMNECDVNEVINDVVTQLQSMIFEKHATINLSLEVKTIKYPRGYLESIFYNFISNAMKYCKPAVPPVICIATRHCGEKIWLSVKDNGLGIDMERHGDKIFKLNQVFHAGPDSKGFGLYLTKTQIESLGGTITVESKENEGCEFVVLI